METARSEYPVRPGDVLAGKYTVERVLGAGGMGVVVAAHHIHLDEHVAIKFMLPEIAAKGGEPVSRFMREGRAAVKIRSEHVARVTDVGLLDNGAPYLVMEYLQGRDLEQVLRASGRLPVEDALDYVLQASEAIAEAHSLGIVHRDLKPANLFLAHRADGSPCVKVLDFGISKMARSGASGVTRTQAMMGSPLYMSPEQVTSAGAVDARADIWSLGVMVYQLVSGQLPFEADTLAQLVYKIVHTQAPPLRDVVPGVHPSLDAAVMRCLERDRGARFQSVGELAIALGPAAPARCDLSIQRIARLLGTTGSGPIPRPAFSSAPPVPGLTPVPGPPRLRAGLVAIVALLALGVLGGGAGLMWMRSARTRPAPAGPDTTTAATAAPDPPPALPTAALDPIAPPASASAPKARAAPAHSSTAAAAAPATASTHHAPTVVPDDRQ